MNIHVEYLIKKIFTHFIGKKILKKNKVGNNLYFPGTPAKEVKKILIFLNNTVYAHLGDQLFFEPLVKQLKNRGFEVIISPTKAMEEYFEKLGYRVERKPDLRCFDLVITRADFFYMLKEYKNILYVETTGIDSNICNFIVKNVMGYIGSEIEKNYCDIP